MKKLTHVVEDHLRKPVFRRGSFDSSYGLQFSVGIRKYFLLLENHSSLHAVERVDPLDSDTYARILQKCIDRKALEMGKRVHQHIIRIGFQPDIYLENNIVNMYAKCGSIMDARQMFDKMAERDVVSWNAIIAAYAQHGRCREAFKLFCEMQRTGMKSNQFTFVSVLRACSAPVALDLCKQDMPSRRMGWRPCTFFTECNPPA